MNFVGAGPDGDGVAVSLSMRARLVGNVGGIARPVLVGANRRALMPCAPRGPVVDESSETAPCHRAIGALAC